MTAPAPPRGAPPRPAPPRVRIGGGQRKALRGAVLAGAQSLPRSASILLGAAASPGEPDLRGLLTAAGSLYTYAVEVCGKILLPGSLPEKAGAVPAPYREIFRSHGKKFGTALRKLPAGCVLMRRGPFDPRIFDPRIFDTGLNVSLASRTHPLYLDMSPNGHPVSPHSPDPAHLAKAVDGLERAVEKRVAQDGLTGPGGASPGRGGGQE